MTEEFRVASLDEVFSFPGYADWEREYGEECGDPVLGQPNVQYELLKELSKNGDLKCVVMLADGQLAGCAAVRFTRSSHYDAPFASSEAMYLRAPWRKGGNGLRLLRMLGRVAIDGGARGVVFSPPAGSTFSKLLSRLGMKHTHDVYWYAC